MGPTHSQPSTHPHSWVLQNHSSNWWSELGLQGRRESEGENVLRFTCVLFFATPWTVAHQAPLSMGILQSRILEWVAIPLSRRSSWHGNQARGWDLVLCFGDNKTKLMWSYVCVCSVASVMSNSAMLYAVVCQAPLSMGILQARVLEWVAMPSSRPSWSRDWTCISYVSHTGKQIPYH